jgi:potassium efflux system protein
VVERRRFGQSRPKAGKLPAIDEADALWSTEIALQKSIFAITLALLLLVVPVLAQPTADDTYASAAGIEKLQAALAEVEKSLERPNLSDAGLQALRANVDPISVGARAAIESLEPKLAAIKARLEQLGPKPDEKGKQSTLPAETPDITNERADETKEFSDVEGLLKRARLIAVRADQAASSITARRRALFTKSLFEQVSSIANPQLWSDVWRELPRHATAATEFLGEGIASLDSKLGRRQSTLFWGSLVLLGMIAAAISNLAIRAWPRMFTSTEPDRLAKCFRACWVTAAIVVPAATAIGAIRLESVYLGLNYEPLTPLWNTIVFVTIRMAAILGLLLGLLAPGQPDWRLLERSDTEAARTFTLAFVVVSLASVTRILESFNDIVGASLAFSVATRGLHAAFVAITLCVGLWRLIGRNRDDAGLGSSVGRERDWFSLFRLAAWPLTFAIIVSILIGYITFANFLIDQLVLIGTVLCVLFLAITLVDEIIVAAPTSAFGNRLRNSLGLGRSGFVLLGVVVSGLLRFCLYTLAILLVVAPWGLQSSDVTFDIAAVFFGFRVGDITISPASILVAIAIFAAIYGLTRAMLGWVEKSLLPATGLDLGLRNAIRTSLDYLGFMLAAVLALGYLGLGVEKIALVAGALSVGIGFGLQSIFNNFVSGLILLWERAVRVGDWIVVGSDQGYVRRINVRSTEIETFDRSQVIIPNSSLITGVVKNLVRNDKTGRINIEVSVAGTADPERVREVLFAIAKAHELVLKFPAPQILFTKMSGSTLGFELNAYVSDVEFGLRVRSDLHFEIFKRFKAEKFFDGPGPDPTKVEIAGLGDLAARLGEPIAVAVQPKQHSDAHSEKSRRVEHSEASLDNAS